MPSGDATKRSRPHVVYWNNIPAPYMVERFNAVARRGNLDFEAWFNEESEPGRSWRVEESSWLFRYRYMPVVKFGKNRFTSPTPIARCRKPDLLVSLYAEPRFLLGWQIARLRGVRTAFWAEVTFDSWVRRSGWKEQLKRYIFPRASAVITAGPDGKSFAARYGAPGNRIFVLPHVIDSKHFREGSAAAGPNREDLRNRLGLKGVTFISVGRLWRGKGLRCLIDAFAGVQAGFPGETSLLLVGDGPDEASLHEQVDDLGLRNVIFAGFHDRDTLPGLYAAADVFVFPTLGDPWGLVVEEAMACGLPVVCSNAAGEISERLTDGLEGFIVPAGDSCELRSKMELLASTPDLREDMGLAGKRRTAGASPANWAADFEDLVAVLLEN